MIAIRYRIEALMDDAPSVAYAMPPVVAQRDPEPAR
jgi:hypothetical protein